MKRIRTWAGRLCLAAWMTTAGLSAAQPVAEGAAAVAAALLGREPTAAEGASAGTLWQAVESRDELLADWLLQDLDLRDGADVFARANLAARLQDRLRKQAPEDAACLRAACEAYRTACLKRRAARLAPLRDTRPRWVYARHAVMGGSHYAYTEALADAQSERTFHKGSSLCLATWRDDGLWQEEALLVSPHGMIRDVDVDYSGERLLFSHKKSDRGDDYCLYEMDIATRAIRQVTHEPGFADYEGCYLPDGSILFNSTRCMQIVDCWWTEVSNLYCCDPDGGRIRRITFDQVHNNYPAVAYDGTVLYTRWEYNDRSQLYPQPLFQMAPDGTRQRAVYGENAWFPTTIIHARAIPGSRRIFAVATGHHSWQPGELIRIDPAKGRQEAEGIMRVAPVRETKAVRIDAYGQEGPLFAYPYPLSEQALVVTALPTGWTLREGRRQRHRTAPFGLYWMTIDGQRELLVSRQADRPCGRAVPLAPRQRPQRPGRAVDTRDDGTFYIQDVYVGEPMAGVARGTIKTLRVISLDYRVAGIGHNSNGGPGGSALVSTPVAIGNGAWDPKIVIGDAPVHADGSLFFRAEARRPLYFMLLDGQGRMVQSMRSWTVLQPGENASCVGCHESPNSTPLAASRVTQALIAGPAVLRPALGPVRGFSFLKEVQPILDQRCVACHNGRHAGRPDLRATPVADPVACRTWTQSYLSLTHTRTNDNGNIMRADADHKILNWISAASTVKLLPPRFRGSGSSALFEMLDKGHAKGITGAEKAVLALWVDLGVPFCGDYTEAALWNEAQWAKHRHFQAKRERAARKTALPCHPVTFFRDRD